MARPGGQAPSTAGSPVDSQGWPAEDPTANVRATVGDLKEVLDREVAHLKEVGAIRATHLKEIADLRAKHEEAMRVKEAGRLDSIRSVDVGAVQQAAKVASDAAQALATQVALTAETLRTAVAVAAAESDSKLAAVQASWESKLSIALTPLTDAVGRLSQAQYEQAGGKAQVAETRVDTRDTKDNSNAIRMAIIAAVGLLITFMFSAAGIAIALLVK